MTILCSEQRAGCIETQPGRFEEVSQMECIDGSRGLGVRC